VPGKGDRVFSMKALTVLFFATTTAMTGFLLAFGVRRLLGRPLPLPRTLLAGAGAVPSLFRSSAPGCARTRTSCRRCDPACSGWGWHCSPAWPSSWSPPLCCNSGRTAAQQLPPARLDAEPLEILTLVSQALRGRLYPRESDLDPKHVVAVAGRGLACVPQHARPPRLFAGRTLRDGGAEVGEHEPAATRRRRCPVRGSSCGTSGWVLVSGCSGNPS
jgi:hypothetical protein